MKLKLRRNLSPGENASIYFERAKKIKKKISSLKKEIKETEKRLEKEKQKEVKIEEKEVKKIRKREWYEKFRWFLSSSGILCLGGRDARTNEVVIKKHSTPDSIIFHTSFSGSPFVVIQEKDPDENTIKEAAIFCGANSKAWKEGLRSCRVFWIRGEQVSKTAKAGEYLTKGAFMIYGKKNFMEVDLKIAIGEVDGQIFGGPEESLKGKTKNYVAIIPGDERSSDIAKKVRENLGIEIPLEEIQAFMPPGNSEIASG